jgi:phenylpyruvate tautomerase PptA (4-oxalocrotonate tautomerase family)
MPFLNCQTNVALDDPAREAFSRKLLACVCESLGKPAEVTMVALDCTDVIVMGESTDPAVFLDLRALALSADKVGPVVEALTKLCGEELGARAERVHVNCTDIPRTHWGYNARPMA